MLRVFVSAVHVRRERVVVLVVLPVVAIALIIRLLRRPLASSDDWQTAVTWVRATNEQTSTQPKQTNKQSEHKHRPRTEKQVDRYINTQKKKKQLISKRLREELRRRDRETQWGLTTACRKRKEEEGEEEKAREKRRRRSRWKLFR